MAKYRVFYKPLGTEEIRIREFDMWTDFRHFRMIIHSKSFAYKTYVRHLGDWLEQFHFAGSTIDDLMRRGVPLIFDEEEFED